jgi:hypothetical protein
MKLFWTLVVVGLALEFREDSQADKIVADTESANLVLATKLETLRSNNIAQARDVHIALRQGGCVERLFGLGFPDKVKSGPRGEAVILFDETNLEAIDFARSISSVLKGGGWKVRSLAPITPENISGIATPDGAKEMESLLGMTEVQGGVCIASCHLNDNKAGCFLVHSFLECSIPCIVFSGDQFPTENTVIIFVPKRL